MGANGIWARRAGIFAHGTVSTAHDCRRVGSSLGTYILALALFHFRRIRKLVVVFGGGLVSVAVYVDIRLPHL